MKQPSLHIPYKPQLDTLEMSQVANALEEGGTRFALETLNWPEQYPYKPLTVVTAAHSGSTLYLDFLVRCNYLRAEHGADNEEVSEDSCVEFFIEPRAGEQYWNFEMNCIGALYLSQRWDRYRKTMATPEQLARVRRYASVGSRPFCEVEGSFVWNVVMAIPLDLIGVRYTPGEPVAMRGNFYKCASETSQPHYLTWAPISSPEPDFHRPEAFAPIILD